MINPLTDENMKWEIEVSFIKNPIIIKQLLLALGLPFGILFLILIISTNGEFLMHDNTYFLVMLGLLFSLTLIMIMILYRGKYAAGFIISQEGIQNYTQQKQRTVNRVVNGMLMLLGLLKGKPGFVGIGMIAQSRQSVFVKWRSIRKLKLYPQSLSILVDGGFGEQIAVFCNSDNYDDVVSVIQQRMIKTKKII